MPCACLYGARNANMKCSQNDYAGTKSSSSIDFSAAGHRSADANADMLTFAGRRPAMKQHQGSAVLGKSGNVC